MIPDLQALVALAVVAVPIGLWLSRKTYHLGTTLAAGGAAVLGGLGAGWLSAAALNRATEGDSGGAHGLGLLFLFLGCVIPAGLIGAAFGAAVMTFLCRVISPNHP